MDMGHNSVVDTQERQKEGVCSFMVSRMRWLAGGLHAGPPRHPPGTFPGPGAHSPPQSRGLIVSMDSGLC